MVPQADSDTEIASLKSGEVDFIFPQAFAGIADALAATRTSTSTSGLRQRTTRACTSSSSTGPFADDDFRQAFSKSIDRDAILAADLRPDLRRAAELLNCGLLGPDDRRLVRRHGVFDGRRLTTRTAAEQILTDAGWEKNGDGFWAKDGAAPRSAGWSTPATPAVRSTQALLIPLLQEAGFNVVADNCDAACVFQQRLPALDYDLAMYINTAPPDPTVTGIMACDRSRPRRTTTSRSEQHGLVQRGGHGAHDQSDQTSTTPPAPSWSTRSPRYLAEDACMLPLYQFPNIAAWRTDKVGGPVDEDAAQLPGLPEHPRVGGRRR